MSLKSAQKGQQEPLHKIIRKQKGDFHFFLASAHNSISLNTLTIQASLPRKNGKSEFGPGRRPLSVIFVSPIAFGVVLPASRAANAVRRTKWGEHGVWTFSSSRSLEEPNKAAGACKRYEVDAVIGQSTFSYLPLIVRKRVPFPTTQEKRKPKSKLEAPSKIISCFPKT